MKEFLAYPDVALELIKRYRKNINVELLSYEDLSKALTELANDPARRYRVTDIPWPKDQNKYLDNVISDVSEFPIKFEPIEVDAEGKVVTYLFSSTAKQILTENVSFLERDIWQVFEMLSDDQLAKALEILPQSKFRSYKVGPIPFDREEWLERGNVISEVQDFNDANHRNPKEIEYWDQRHKKNL